MALSKASPIALPLTGRRLFSISVSVIEALKMEFLAILVLGVSAVLSFSSSDRKPKTKTNHNHDNDPDLVFTQSGDLKGGNDEK